MATKEDNKPLHSSSPSWAHVYVHKKFKEKAKFSDYIRPKQMIEIIKRTLRVPHNLHYPILKQMEEEGLIKRINHQKYEYSSPERDEKLKEINEKLKKLEQKSKNNPQVTTIDKMLKTMEKMGLIKKDKTTKFRILTSDFDDKLKSMGNYTFW